MAGFVAVPVLRGLDTIAPLMALWEDHAYFCGGFVRWMASPRRDPIPPGDIDLYPRTWEDCDKIRDDMKDRRFKLLFESSVAASYQAPSTWGEDYPKIQVIFPEDQGAIKATGDLQDIIGNFDFTVVRAGLLDPDYAFVDADFVDDEMSLRLRIKNIHCPISSTLRLAKYVKKGYSARAEDVLPLFVDWENRDEAYKEALRVGLPRLRARGEDALSEEEKTRLVQLIYID